MQGIEITLKRNKQFVAENKEDYEIISGENNATTILVHFPEEYKLFSKRVDFKNIKNEKWSIALYTPEDETKKYGEDFDKLNFAFTLPTAVTINGELQIQFIAYLTDDTETFVPFKLFKIVVEDSIMYVKKQGSENPDLILQAYEYANMALEISRDAFNRISNAERVALEAEKSAKAAQTSASSAQASATNAQNSATSANTRATNAEASAKAAQQSAEYAEEVADNANTKSDNAVATSNSANTKSDSAVTTASEAKNNATSAVSTANSANTKSDNAVSVSNTANTKSTNAVSTANEAKEIAEEALNQVVSKMGTKVFIGSNTTPEPNVNFDSDPQTQINNIKNNTTIISNSNGGFSCGSGATNGSGMQFKGFTVCDENGKIPAARVIDAIYPVGSIYMSVNATRPETLFGGTWEELKDRFLLGAGSIYTNASTGGESTHTLSVAEIPSHTHSYEKSATSTGSTTLSVSQMPSHSHRVWSTNTWSSNAVGLLHGKAYGFAGVDQSSGTEQYTSTENTDGVQMIESSGGGGSHNHSITLASTATTSTGSTSAHNNMPPYLVVHMWKRTS